MTDEQFAYRSLMDFQVKWSIARYRTMMRKPRRKGNIAELAAILAAIGARSFR